jgi:hypothetical protein
MVDVVPLVKKRKLYQRTRLEGVCIQDAETLPRHHLVSKIIMYQKRTMLIDSPPASGKISLKMLCLAKWEVEGKKNVVHIQCAGYDDQTKIRGICSTITRLVKTLILW